jgi:hypothetical protein
MGLMDNIKKAQEMAQQAAQGSSASPSAGDAQYANLAMKLNQSGVPGVATINSITESGEGSDPVNKAYDIVVHQYLTQDAVNAYQPGGRFEVKADPDDPTQVMLYGQA